MAFTVSEFEILAEKTLLFLMVIDKDGKLITMNQRCETIFPFSKKEARGKSIIAFLIDEDASVMRQTLSSLTEENSKQNIRFRFVTKDKALVSLKIDFVLNTQVIYITGIDTTEEDKEHASLITLSKLTKTGAWHFNPKTEELYWSKECYHLHNLDTSIPITRAKGASYYPESSRAHVEHYLDTLITTKNPYEYTEKITTENGTEKWVKVIGNPVLHDDEVVFVNGTIADITERHLDVEKLKSNEETKHLALKGIRSGLFDHHIEENEVFYSHDFRKMLGLPLDIDFMPEETFRTMIHPDDAEDALKRHYENLEKDGNHYLNHYRLKHLEGGYRHYEVYGYRKKNEENKTTRMIGNLIDIHQKKINEKTIAENKNKLEAIVNNGFVYTILVDTKGVILMADQNSLDIIKHDYDVNPIETECRFIDVMPVNFKNIFAHGFNRACQGELVRKEVERVTHKGAVQWLEVKYTPIVDTTKIISTVLLSFHDITERKLAELATKEAHIRAHELNDIKSNILSNLSHEIRTPLNGIMTISDLLLHEDQPSERKKLLKYLEESKDRLLMTINNLSNFSESETIKEYLNYSNTDMNYCVETSYRAYRHIANTKKLQYDLKLDESCPTAHIDSDIFSTALNNIIHNAIKYTPKGSITIAVFTKPSKPKNIYITVEDTGIGIQKKNISKIFDPFVQESFGLSRKYEGTGIGLSLSKKYIEILGGRIKIKSKVKKGTVFTITIPALL